MSVFIKRMDGVDAVEVSLQSGVATVKLKPGNHLTVDEVRDAIRKNGFTPKDAEVTVVGRLVERNGQAALAVSGQELVYRLTASSGISLEAHGNKEVLISGHLAASPAASSPLLDVKAMQPAPVDGRR